LEPTLFRALEQGRPLSMEPRPIPPSIEDFLDSVWRRFGAHSADHLSRQLKAHPPYRDAWEKAPRAEIPLSAMRAFYGTRTSARQGAPELDNVLRPKVMRSHTGRPVSVSKWLPPAKPSGTKAED
ncbi:MAG TPA: hypothetical protein VEB64_17165, partial [Azospirillaceae bacterium]|nr:hypothetical protein [Azospirillaceae bacterium]